MNEQVYMTIGHVLKLLKELQDEPRYQEIDIGANFIADICKELQAKTVDQNVFTMFEEPDTGLLPI